MIFAGKKLTPTITRALAGGILGGIAGYGAAAAYNTNTGDMRVNPWTAALAGSLLFGAYGMSRGFNRMARLVQEGRGDEYLRFSEVVGAGWNKLKGAVSKAYSFVKGETPRAKGFVSNTATNIGNRATGIFGRYNRAITAAETAGNAKRFTIFKDAEGNAVTIGAGVFPAVGYAALAGAGLGAGYGLLSSKDNMMSGAFKGAILGGIAGYGYYGAKFVRPIRPIPTAASSTAATAASESVSAAPTIIRATR